MKILALVGSPREGGNTELLVDEVIKGSVHNNDDNEFEKIFISNLTILPCTGCMECRQTGKCDQEDDLSQLLEKINWSDVIISASPVYGNHLPGHYKVLFDRLVGVMHKIDNSVPGKLTTYSRLDKKKRNIGLIAVAGAPRESSCDQVIGFMKRVFTPESNGGLLLEMRAIGLSAKGQLAMAEDQLAELAAKLSVPDKKQLVDKMRDRNEIYVQQAYKLGEQLGENA